MVYKLLTRQLTPSPSFVNKFVCVCVCACVRACVRVCARAQFLNVSDTSPPREIRVSVSGQTSSDRVVLFNLSNEMKEVKFLFT